jgi:hypothetical protein
MCRTSKDKIVIEYQFLIDTVYLQELTLVKYLLARMQFLKFQRMPMLI